MSKLNILKLKNTYKSQGNQHTHIHYLKKHCNIYIISQFNILISIII